MARRSRSTEGPARTFLLPPRRPTFSSRPEQVRSPRCYTSTLGGSRQPSSRPPSLSLGCGSLGALPRARGPRVEPASPIEAAIERQELCIGSSVRSAGKLADALYYRWARAPSGQIAVGYFVFYSQERPWGNNWLTWTFFPALFVDMAYSHMLLVAPGYQRLTKGEGGSRRRPRHLRRARGRDTCPESRAGRQP